jgi:hypothetical protein
MTTYPKKSEFCSSNRTRASNLGYQGASQALGSAIGGREPDTTHDNARDMGLLSHKFKLAPFSTAFADWRAVHPSADADTGLNKASLDELLE